MPPCLHQGALRRHLPAPADVAAPLEYPSNHMHCMHVGKKLGCGRLSLSMHMAHTAMLMTLLAQACAGQRPGFHLQHGAPQRLGPALCAITSDSGQRLCSWRPAGPFLACACPICLQIHIGMGVHRVYKVRIAMALKELLLHAGSGASMVDTATATATATATIAAVPCSRLPRP